ncbi:wax ester/triacylglycerol synthase family O-acyltransferase [Nocardioides sp. dk4132]|uniref:WS/DGAT/MGAT family O-acyltransferase n=1 Tax=unclassified Nocardioides TaxID=2615069 RepID=UPI001295103C|nr:MULTISPECIES: wax ester/triacylglycerol synthase family O-acyltransferase [unclassified Nocardioides]MQW76051.1 wax ester/triacylglycerol synthase family O-acyltransferase [Nocardioides sp. dk4132]QGA08901.1 wax ester/triacylglycerol synthase family O-acyltransferase [Nocardioides sp. dk884]
MAALIDPTSVGFLTVENRSQPMHVGSLQLFENPTEAGPDYTRQMYDGMRQSAHTRPLFLRHPHRSIATGGQLVWRPDEQFDIDHHVRHSALPAPGEVRDLLDLCGRLHSTRLPRERPLWEAHVIEGLADGRVALYTKIHHALLDGVSASRLLQSVLSTDPDRRGMPAPWDAGEPDPPAEADHDVETAVVDASPSSLALPLAEVPIQALRSALALASEAAGMPAALLRTLSRAARSEASAISLQAPRTIFNQQITGSRRIGAQGWPVDRLRRVGKAGDATLNDVVLAMCAGAVRRYLLELDALPSAPLVAMVPVGLRARESQLASVEGGNAVGAVMCRLGTDLADPADRLETIHRSMRAGKEALASMTPLQIVAMSALGQMPAILPPLLRMQGLVHSPYNLIISNVPGPRTTHYWNGARLVGSYPLSIPINGMALNITCTSYADTMCFGLTGCRRTVPSLQLMLGHLDAELDALELAVGA